MRGYDPQEIERHWQQRWDEDGLHRFDTASPAPFYNLVEFPYPSAEGLHVGHVRTYCGADCVGRYRRMRGRDVFQPIGFDAFGIHAENYALKIGEHPRRVIERTTANYRRQLSRVGCAWDWSRQIRTSDPDYYRWTQWIFLRLYEAGLAYRTEAPAVWCPSCLTVLAFEQLEGDACERCGTRVEERRMAQWFLRITAYADALLDGLDDLDWPEWAKGEQREWIGRSSGAEVDFRTTDGATLTTFTTRPDTLFGVTFLVVSPGHPVAGSGAAAAFARRSLSRSPSERFERTAEGARCDVRAIHPLTGAELPVFVADYVVGAYGTGVVMGVPAHDKRDHAFARAHGLPVLPVVRPDEDPGAEVWTGEGTLTASGDLDGLGSQDARAAIVERLEASGTGRPATRYRLHDWLISRQRYWGPPIPLVHCASCGVVPVPDDDLPVVLPETEDVRPTGTGRSPLAALPSFVRVDCPECGRVAERETDVSDTFLDSAWYFLRYPCTDVEDAPWDPERIAHLLPVDRYEGGREHVRRHHLYARFLCHALHDLGLLPFREPFPTIRIHGLIDLAGAKMSKSRGNVVSPDTYVDEVGADNLRLYLLFCGPWEGGGEFSDAGLRGAVRFTERAWRLVTGPGPSGPGADLRPLHRTIARVTADIEADRFNTAVAELMGCARWMGDEREGMTPAEWEDTVSAFVRLLAPFVPHLAEELWSRIGGTSSVHVVEWPAADPAALEVDEVTIAVQMDGRTRDTVRVRAGAVEDAVLEAALASEQVQRALEGREPRATVFVPDRVLNLLT